MAHTQGRSRSDGNIFRAPVAQQPAARFLEPPAPPAPSNVLASQMRANMRGVFMRVFGRVN